MIYQQGDSHAIPVKERLQRVLEEFLDDNQALMHPGSNVKHGGGWGRDTQKQLE